LNETKNFFQDTFEQMKELKNIINKYKDFDESAIKILLNQINEALKSQNYTLTSIKKCKRIIKNA
jgi:negative regulator of sigma E activity